MPDQFDQIRAKASSEETPPEELLSLAAHEDSAVRALVARNLKTPLDILKVMTLDTNVAIRDSARFTLGRLGRPEIQEVVIEKPVVEKESNQSEELDKVIDDIKKDKRKNKRKRKGRKK